MTSSLADDQTFAPTQDAVASIGDATPNLRPSATLRELFDASKRACTHWNDSPAARQAMAQQCSEIPAHLRADLIQHFEETYP